MAFKVFIVLLWLSVPVCGTLLVRADVQRFDAQSAAQRELAAQYSAELSRHSAAVMREARRISRQQGERGMLQWRRDWQVLRRGIERDIAAFDNAPLGYCPATSGMLLEQRATLSRLMDKAESGARDQEYLLRSEQLLSQMAEEQNMLRWYSRQYQQMPGGRGIYLNLQDELAKQETRYQSQHRERSRLRQAVSEQLAAAEQDERVLQAALSRSSILLAQDASQTYLEDMRERWQRFDLKDEIAALLTRLSGANV